MAITNRGPLRQEMKRAVWEKTGGRCWYCGCVTIFRASIGGGYLENESHFDHQKPYVKGGEMSIENLVLACGKCNLSKGKLSVEEFRIAVRKRAETYEWLIGRINELGEWERGLLHDEVIAALRGLFEWHRTRTIVFYGEQLGSKPLDYCI